MALATKIVKECHLSNEDHIVVEKKEEEEDELFEINLEAVNNIPPPQYCWDSYFTATGNALLANCMLPIADVSSAVPMQSKACDAMNWPRSAAGFRSSLLVMAESKPGELPSFSSLVTSGAQNKQTKT